MNAELRTYREFWPTYVGEHRKRATRAIHFAGTSTAIVFLLLALVTLNAWWLLAVPVAGYGAAWFSHAFVERNKPATFTHPLWSLIGDFHMYWLICQGRMDAEVAHNERLGPVPTTRDKDEDQHRDASPRVEPAP